MNGQITNDPKIFIKKRFTRNSAVSVNTDANWSMKPSNSNYAIPEGYAPIGLMTFSSGSVHVSVAQVAAANLYINPTSTSSILAGRNNSGASRTITPSLMVLFVNEDYVTYDVE